MRLKRGNRLGQVTVFIIIAIVLVVGIVSFFVFGDRLFQENIPSELQPVFSHYLTCIEEVVTEGVGILGSQGGYIEKPDFVPGNDYMPFSSQLEFLGFGVPYWYYVSGNGFVEEQVPTKRNMEEELNKFIEENLVNCNFDNFYDSGFEIDLEVESASVNIVDNKIDVGLQSELVVSKGETSAKKSRYDVEVNSHLGKFYELARKIYNKEKEEVFLENYAVDVLRLYAPVDGVELTCAPKTWLQEDIKNEFVEALSVNVQSIKVKGDYYSLKDEEDKYFVQDIGEAVDTNVNFLYSFDWPTKVEISPNDDPLVAKPVGMQEGLGILGFCYVPYHFVYDVGFPVLIQIYDSEEMFQFPVAVVLRGNQAREGVVGEPYVEPEVELCKYKNQEIGIYTYDVGLGAVEAEVSFECLNQECDIGKTKLNDDGDAYLNGLFPQCGNGYVRVEAEGYASKRELYSTNQGGDLNILLFELFELDVDLKVDGQTTSDYALVTFRSDDYARTVAWPEQKQIELSEGEYDISVYVYKSSNVNIPALKKEHCSEVPKEGLAGVLGMTEEKCINIDLPAQSLSNIISGGGKGTSYIADSQLKSGKMEISVQGIPVPKSLEELQDGYNLVEAKSVYINF